MNKPLSFSIVIPCYNEKESISSILKDYKKFEKKYNFTLIYVDNGSTDGAGKVLSNFSKNSKYKFLEVVSIKQNIGYGHGIMRGVKSAKSEIIAWTHADSQTPPKDIFRAYDTYSKFSDELVIIKGKRMNRVLIDSIVSKCMGLIATLILGTHLSEINAQPKLFHKNFIKHLTNPPNDFSLDLFFLYKAQKMGYKLVSIDVSFLKRKHGVSKWSYSLGSRLRMIKKTIKYCFYLRSIKKS